MTNQLRFASGVAPVTLGTIDWVRSGRIGQTDLSKGCYSFYETWTVAAEDLVRTGRAGQAEALLRSGVTVRELFGQFYGIWLQAGEDEAAEARAFLRTLARACMRLPGRAF